MNKEKEITSEEAVEEFRLVYQDVIAFIKKYLDLGDDHYHIVALWILGTYLHKEFKTYPFLFFNAMKGSGKTRSLRIISYLQDRGNGDVLNNASEAVIFRTAKETGLIFDEFEQIGSRDKQTLREILNAAYKVGGKVKRMRKAKTSKGEKQVVESFDIYTPVAIANIWGMNEVLGDRCITLTLEKSTKREIVKRMEDFDNNPIIKGIKKGLGKIKCSLCNVITQKDYMKEWNKFLDEKQIYTNTQPTVTTRVYTNYIKPDLKPLFTRIDQSQIDGRNLELLFPLLIVSYLLGEKIFEKTLEISKKLVEIKKSEELTESKDVSLFDFVSKLDTSYQINYHSTSEICREFREFIGDFEEDDRWLNTHWLGRALKRLNLVTSKRRVARGTEVTLSISKAKEKAKMFK